MGVLRKNFKMWTRFRKMIKQDKKQTKEPNDLNVKDEYFGAFRTNSYSDFFMKAQPLVHHNTSSSSSSSSSRHCRIITELLLNPNQEIVTAILESPTLFNKSSHCNNLKSVFLNYFNVSSDASRFCSRLLQTLNQVQSDHKSIHKALNSIDGEYQEFDLRSCLSDLKDPFFYMKKHNFIRCHEKHSSVLQQLRRERKKVASKKKTLGILKYDFFSKIQEQLDVAAKGTYILNRDFDTMSRLVDLLQDQMEHSKMMIRLCLDRREDRVPNEVMKEVKKRQLGLLRLVKEVEEHVYLCLLTINRGRALVIKEISSLV